MVRATTVNMFDAISHGWSRRSVRGRAYLISFLPSVTSQLPGGTDPGGAKNFGNLPHLSSPIPGTFFCDSPNSDGVAGDLGFAGYRLGWGTPQGLVFDFPFRMATPRFSVRADAVRNGVARGGGPRDIVRSHPSRSNPGYISDHVRPLGSECTPFACSFPAGRYAMFAGEFVS
jgi:hypothetical protein